MEVPAVMVSDLNKDRGEPTRDVAARVFRAREIQAERYASLSPDAKSPITVNAHVQGEMLENTMPLSESAKALLNKAAERMRLSARSYYRLIRVARTIADLEGHLGDIKDTHIAESLSYRKINLTY